MNKDKGQIGNSIGIESNEEEVCIRENLVRLADTNVILF